MGERAEGPSCRPAPGACLVGGRCGAHRAGLALVQDPSVEVLPRDPQAGAELDGLELTVMDRAANGGLGELAGVGDVLDRHQRLGDARL